MKRSFIKYILLRMLPVAAVICIITWFVNISFYQSDCIDYMESQLLHMSRLITKTEEVYGKSSETLENAVLLKAQEAAQIFDESLELSYEELKIKIEELGIKDIYVFNKLGESVFEENAETRKLSTSRIFTDALFDIPSASEIVTDHNGEEVMYAAVRRRDNNGVIIISVTHDGAEYLNEDRICRSVVSAVHMNMNEFAFVADPDDGRIIAFAKYEDKNNKVDASAAVQLMSEYDKGDGRDTVKIGDMKFRYGCMRFKDLIIGYAMPVGYFTGETGKSMLLFVISVVVFLLIFFMFCIEWMEKNILSGFKSLSREIREFTGANIQNSHVTENDTSEEFALLCANINNFIDSLSSIQNERDKILNENRFLLDEQDMLLAERQLFIEMTTVENMDAASETRARNEIFMYLTKKLRVSVDMILSIYELIMLEPMNKELRTHIIDLKIASCDLISTLDDITDISSIDSGKLEIIPEAYYTRMLVRDIQSAHNLQAKKKNIEFRVDIDKEIPQRLSGDRVRVHQIVSNILRTSISATDKGYVSLSVKFEKIDETRVKLIFVISDTGTGIKPEETENLFKPFRNSGAREAETSEYTNNIELEIAKKLAVMMGGDVDATSRYGHGSVFSVYIMQEIPESDDAENRNYREEGISMNLFSAPEARVLIIDSSGTYTRIISAFLKLMDIRVDVCNNSRKAEELMHKNNYNIVFISHPGLYPPEGLSCMELAWRVRSFKAQHSHELVIIAVSPDASAGTKNMFISAGINDIILKPIKPTVLAELIRRYLPESLIKQKGDGEDWENRTQALDIEGINTAKGMANCGQNVEIYTDLLKIFEKNLEENLEKLEKFRGNNDFKNYKICVHDIKMNAANIGADELELIADSLEDAAGEFNGIFISANTAEFIARSRSIITAIKNYFDGYDE
ncbi:MAG: hypothetical protein J1F64_02445 [Oscillospiraceae bacterium]|nr:hypothetical protein [Oscillospiraceae bacterium]